MRHTRFLAVLLAAIAVATGAFNAPPAHADEGSMATYDGRQIDLSSDWEGAQACAILVTGNYCFDSQEELEAELGGEDSLAASSVDSESLLTYCNGNGSLWLVLYENTSFGGRSLSFRDQGIWQNMSTYSFDNQMSSWDNNTGCTAYAAVDANGGGTWLTMTASSSATSVGTFDNLTSSIYIT